MVIFKNTFGFLTTHISTVNMSRTWQIWQTLLLTTNGKWHKAFPLASLYLTFTYSIFQCQGHAHFDGELLADGERLRTLQLPASIKSHTAFHRHIYIWPWPVLKVKVKVKIIYSSTVNISQTATYRANMAVANKYKVTCGLSITGFKFDLDLS